MGGEGARQRAVRRHSRSLHFSGAKMTCIQIDLCSFCVELLAIIPKSKLLYGFVFVVDFFSFAIGYR